MSKKEALKWRRDVLIEVDKTYHLGAVLQVLGTSINTKGAIHVPELKFFSVGKVVKIDPIAKNATLRGIELVKNGHAGCYKLGKKEFHFVLPLPS